MSRFFYWFITKGVRYFLVPIYANLRITGLDNVPLEGPLIIAANHLNDADPGIVAIHFPRRIFFMAKVELFKIPVLAQFMRAYGAFPVRRGEADLSALRRSKQVLNAGGVLCLFPEGRGSGRSARLVEAWPGAGLIALQCRASVLPVAITGSQRMRMPWLFFRPFRREQITVTIGKPMELPAPQRVNAVAAAAATRLIMLQIAALLPPEYRGYYGSEESDAAPPGATADRSD